MEDNLPPDSASEPIFVSPESPARSSIFIGRFGLRAGWSLLIYICMTACLIFAIRFGHDKLTHHDQKTPVHTSAPSPKVDPSVPQPLLPAVTLEFILFATFFLLSWLMSRIEHRRLSTFGLGGRHSLSRFAFGFLWGFIALSLIILSLMGLHLLTFDACLLHGFQIPVWGLALAFGFFLVGMAEEYAFRGYLQFTLTRGLVGLGEKISPKHAHAIAFWMAATITSALFMLAHGNNAGEDKLGFVAIFLAGLLFVVALWRTGSLWWAIGFHTSWDWAQSFVYGVPDSGGLVQGRLFATHVHGNPMLSGGTVGPEGSLLVIPALTLAIVVLAFTKTSPLPSLELEAPQAPAEPAELQPIVA
jgi:membrane protease YdiL (CAAX protease family)